MHVVADYDLFIIGGGINGCGIARDAAGRGLRVGLAEMNDLASATSSASTKLFHGGLRYLEYFEFRLVRESLIERERLLTAMPHISWPMRFVLPLYPGMRFENTTPASKLLNFIMPWMRGRRPSWMIRLALFLYDHMGGRKILPATSRVNLKNGPEGSVLKAQYAKAFEYSDCWVEDSRLVVLNARDAEIRGAEIATRTKVIAATREKEVWQITLEDENGQREVTARTLVNAAGPWVEEIIRQKFRQNTSESVRLVRGSHIVVKRLFDHEKAYFFQGEDGRIIFAIPYQQDFTLIGTTDQPHDDPDTRPQISDEEKSYLMAFANQYFDNPINETDIVWTYSGVRPLYDDGASSASAATRDYVLSLDTDGPPVLNIFGGKITTYRKLAEHALRDLTAVMEIGAPWTAGVPLPGGDFPVQDVESLQQKLQADYSFLSPSWAQRLFRAYGLDAWNILGTAHSPDDLGRDFGATLSQAEVDWLMTNEYARNADDILWRRGKLGLRFDETAKLELEEYLALQRG